MAPTMEPTRFQRRTIFAVLALVLLAGSGALWWLCAGSDSIAFLSWHPGASWIADVKLEEGSARPIAPQRTIFRRSFCLTNLPENASISIRAFKSASVMLNGRAVPTFAAVIRNTDPGSNAGLPGITLPVGLTSAGLPVGLEFDAPAGRDRELLSFAIALEELLPALPMP